MSHLVLGTAFLLAIHFGIAGTRLRDRLIARLGVGGYLGAFSMLSVLGLGWMILGYGAVHYSPLWPAGPALRTATLVLSAFGFLFVVCGLTTPNPTQVGSERLLAGKGDAARGILRVTRHPFLIGVGLWALGHVLANGDLGSLIFFGGLALLALLGPASIDRRKARLGVEGWPAFAEATSIVPLLAIAQGRNRLRLDELGWWRPLLAAAVFAAALLAHAPVLGVSPFPA